MTMKIATLVEKDGYITHAIVDGEVVPCPGKRFKMAREFRKLGVTHIVSAAQHILEDDPCTLDEYVNDLCC